MKGKKKRLLAGTLALLLSCSTLLNTGITALASEQSEEHAQIQEVKQEEAASETLPELEEVKEQLTEEELVYAEDLTIKAGESFDLETDYRGFQKNDEKVKVTFLKAEGDSGNSFDFNTPGSYQAFYRVDPLSGNPSYQIMRRIVVEARENSTQEPQGEVSQHTEDGSGEDGEADPDLEIPEVLTEEPEMPDAGAELIDLTPKEDKGMFLSVVPAAMEQQKGSNVHLVQGEKIPYPSNVGNYSTSYFTVNGHVAYCLESMKASPPTSDYVANEFESNPELQKVLYYGYGGPGDITGEYMPSFDWKTKYIFTHLAAAYSYCGTDGFYGCTFEDIKASGVWGYIQHIYSLEAPPTAAITLSPKEAKAYESGKEQRTGEFTLKGDHRNYITLKMPEHVTYHSGSTKQTGTVKINGNTTFYFSAPKTVTGTWNSGKLKGQMGTQWKTLVLSTGSGSQDIGYGAFFEEESASVEFTVKWLDLARVKVTKKDKNSKVNLSGAVFGIYSDSACKNLLVQMPATDSNGTSEVEIPKTQDTVYLKEISVPEGYKLNTESFNVKLETGKTTSVAVTNEEQKGKITIRKKGEVLTGVTGEEGNLTFVYGNADFAGAEYNIYAAEDIYSQDKVTKVHKAGDLVESLTTGEDGSAVSKELYLGKYKVVEQKAPENLVIGKTEQERTQFLTLSYAGQNVELSQQLKCGTYRIEEVEAPENYVQVGFENALLKDGKEVPLNEVADGGTYQEAKKAPITITVDSDTVHQVEEETGKFIVVIEQYNDEAVGSLTIHKKGEKLSGASKVEEKFLTKMKNGVAGFVNQVSSFFTGEEVMEKEKGYEFDYEEGNMEGAEFAIHAKETIYTPDGQKDEAGNRIVKYEKDALVARMVTDKEGKAVLNNLPIGKYYVVEEKAGQNCVLDPEAKEFEIAYKGQEVAVDYVTMELTNQRQKVSLSLLKKDAETGKPLEGVVFGLYAQEDIKNAAGEVVVEKDALIELGTTDEEGKLVFQADLPHGKYYIQEVEHKPGYLPNDEVYSFDASYTDQTLELLAFSEEISNQPTITEFTKVDLTGGQEIEGAKMQILDQEGKVVEEWVSKKEAHVVYALAPGEYILHEEQAPTEQGYVRAEDVKFVVEETGDVQKVKMEDDHTKVSISKTDITDGKEIEGAKLQILDQDGEVVESWTTGEEHLIEYLPVGTYTLHEEAAVDGYIVANDVEFTVEETGEIQKVKMEDERAMGQLVIVKTDTDSKAALEGVEFVLLEKETGKEVGRLKTGKDGKAVSELLPIGTYENGVFKEPITYVLKETATLKGYEKTEEEWEIVFTYQNDKTPVIEVVKEIQNKKIPETPGTVKPGPKTGDDTNWFLPLLALGVSAGMVAGLLYYRKRHKKA